MGWEYLWLVRPLCPARLPISDGQDCWEEVQQRIKAVDKKGQLSVSKLS